MTGRERVLRCLEFDCPDRVPRDVWTLPVATIEHGREAVDSFLRRWPTDFTRPPVFSESLISLCEGDAHKIGRFRDEWGCVFENVQEGVMGEVKQPLLDDWSKLARLRPPIEALDFDRQAVKTFCASSDRFVLANCCPRPFERLQFLRGPENVYLDLADDSAELGQLLKTVHEFYLSEVQAWAQTDVDGIMFMDDWGSQRSLLIAPDLWRRRFKPLYEDYVRIAHHAGKKIFMHSDGYIFDIYEDLIEIGVDAINSQLFCMDLEAIGRRFAGRITFWGEIDRQHILPAEDVETVRQAVRRVVSSIHRPQGGVIAQFELGAGARLENAEAVFDTWRTLTES